MEEEIHLVFLHYFGGSAKSWKWVINRLKNDFDCTALDLPGFGGTAPLEQRSIKNFADYILDEIREKKIKPAVLIGHSMSAKLALEAASRAREGEVSRLILVAPSPPTREPMPTKEKQRMLNHPDREEAKKTVEGAAKGKLTKEQFELAVETQLVIDEDTWRWWILEGMEHSIADDVKNLKIPITVLSSDDDPVITPETIKNEVMAVLPHADLKTTINVGHLIPLEAPDWLASEIRAAVHRK